MSTNQSTTAWTILLEQAVTVPGTVSKAYRMFHNYSMGNQLLAAAQCAAREIPLGPLGTFMHWKENGRFVRKGEKALMLCMPITCKGSKTVRDDSTGEESEQAFGFTRFTYKNNWFVMSQTDGEEYQPADLPEWNEAAALAALSIERIEFTLMNGNCQGYAINRQVAISPIGDHQEATLFHELAHIVLGHTAEGRQNSDSADRTPRDIRELEAECVAMLCCESLGLPGVDESRGYIQSWYKGNQVPERSAQKILHAADQILKAGRS